MRPTRVAAAALGALAMSLGASGIAAAKSPLAGTWATTTPGLDWTLIFTAGDDYVARATGVVQGKRQTFVAGAGRLSFATGRVTFRDRPGVGCRGRQAVGTYTWTLRGAALRLTPVREPCRVRRTVLTTVLRKVIR
jgi:hypothetical protein